MNAPRAFDHTLGDKTFGSAHGPRIYNLFPLLAGTVLGWRAELPRIAAMGFDWVYVNPFHQTGGSRSLYAVADPYRLDERFRDGHETSDDAQVAAFVEDAAAHGLKVMTDLVVNHTARDAVLAHERPDLFRKNEKGEIESPYAIDPIDPSIKTVWGDLAELDYHKAEARGFLIEYWDRYVAHLQGLGVKGFRCDAAYKVPADAWTALISNAKTRDPNCVFAAETLGCTFDETKAVAEAGFDYLFNSFAWWDRRAPWALEHYEALRTVAPSIAFPENHDMARLASEMPEDPDFVSRQLKARYALAALFSSGVLMPQGYEWGYRKALHVVNTAPADREDTGVDISEFIAAVNRLRADLPPANVEGAQRRLSAPDSPVLALLRIDGGHPVSASYATLVLTNTGNIPEPVEAGDLIVLAGGGFGHFADMTPGVEPVGFAPGEPLAIQPGEVRIFASARALPQDRPESEKPDGEGRVIIETVWPELDGGRTPVKRVVGDVVEVWADIFTDGHDKVGAEVLYRASDEKEWARVPMVFVDNDRWKGSFPLERNTRYEFTIEAWRDRFASWQSEIEKKAAAGQNVRLEIAEGIEILEKAEQHAGKSDAKALSKILKEVEKEEDGSDAQLTVLLDPFNALRIGKSAERANLTRYPRKLAVIADRLAARFSAWYELFPRSMSDDPIRHGTFADVIRKLPYVRDMGFDVLYFPPIHPIGTTNRKGKNNTLTPSPDDVGSVYAIGSKEGGHDALHPDLGSFEDFRRLIAAAHEYGLEIAIDFAIQCSPDHPWIKDHPDWFDWRPDGTLKFAENPPKKYEDIVNVDFYNKGSLPSLWYALRDVVLCWAREGVRIFRVDNPHTKPLPFWEWMIAEVNAEFPDAIFLSEAFTRPKMMKKLAKIGFQQSYTYFTWRNTKAELTDYVTELAGEMGEYYRPNFFVNTPDINPVPLQTSGRAGYIVRATLASTLSGAWGLYSGFELCEGTPLPGKEEYLDSEKYEIKAWDWNRPGNIRDHVAALNRIRRENPALADFRNIRFLNAWNDNVIAYAKLTEKRDNCVVVLVNLDTTSRQDVDFEIPLWEFGLPDHATIEAEDLLGGGRFALRNKTQRIALDPANRPVVIWRLIPPSPQ
ncbi:maltotransferase domain-containing protein [Flaviflagellibacter deserti]|uniref:Alpha-1,4-glucan:maltose-1-phosphate maltosyltransferase n=1 Tax=Flaviflagellibacter deserti TaxID=2267266 RepID=A0ABV9Z0B4_9HYPH